MGSVPLLQLGVRAPVRTQLLGVSLGARGVPASNTGTHDDEGRGGGTTSH